MWCNQLIIDGCIDVASPGYGHLTRDDNMWWHVSRVWSRTCGHNIIMTSWPESESCHNIDHNHHQINNQQPLVTCWSWCDPSRHNYYNRQSCFVLSESRSSLGPAPPPPPRLPSIQFQVSCQHQQQPPAASQPWRPCLQWPARGWSQGKSNSGYLHCTSPSHQGHHNSVNTGPGNRTEIFLKK